MGGTSSSSSRMLRRLVRSISLMLLSRCGRRRGISQRRSLRRINANLYVRPRYHEILFMIDTCQANTMYSKLYSPNIIATGSSELDQSSYSHHADNDV